MRSRPGKRALLMALGLLLGSVGLVAGQSLERLAGQEARGSYRELGAEVYYPTFFKRYAAERENHAEWLKHRVVGQSLQ